MQIQLDILYPKSYILYPKSSSITEKQGNILQEQERTRLNILSAIHTAILRKQEAREAGTEFGKGRGGLDSDFVEWSQELLSKPP